MEEAVGDRAARLQRARLYLVCGPRPAEFLRAVLAAGVDMVQLRDKHAADADLLSAAQTFRRCCDETGALFILNDRPDLAVACGADGVHVGQDDVSLAEARAASGQSRLIGLSTHSAAQIDAAGEADYIAVGPVHATPTKPGRPATGLGPIEHAAVHAPMPWFAIGGIDPGNVDAVLAAGARRIVVVRAIERAPDPAAAAGALAAALARYPLEVPVGQA